MDQQTRRPNIVALAFVCAFVACVAYIAIHPRLTGVVTWDTSGLADLNDGWTTAEGTPVTLGRLGEIEGFAEQGAVIEHPLPDTVDPGTELCLLGSNLTLRVLCEGAELFSFDPGDSEQNVFYAARFYFVPLPSEAAGKTLHIELGSVDADGGASMTDVFVATSSDYIQRFVRAHGDSLIESLVVVVIGILIIGLHLALRKVDHSDLSLLALGCIAVLLGLWSATVTHVPQLIMGYDAFFRALEYLSLLFVPYPIMRFAASLLLPHDRKRFDLAAGIIASCAIGLTMGLAIAGQKSMRDLLPISHAQLAICALLIAVMLFSRLRLYGVGDLREALGASNPLKIAFLIFVGCGIVDFVLFFTRTAGSDTAFFIRHGLFAFSVVLGVEAARASLRYINRAHYADKIEVIAYTDALTNVGNRTAWKVMRDEVQAALAQGSIADAVVCQFDVNFLKRVNDTMGHAAGDRYIKHAAETINRSFGIEGTCYRTGGDEFSAIIAGDQLQERLEECRALFQTSMAEQSTEEMPMSVALGCAFVSETERRTVLDAQHLADERMYANKRAMKAERVD